MIELVSLKALILQVLYDNINCAVSKNSQHISSCYFLILFHWLSKSLARYSSNIIDKLHQLSQFFKFPDIFQPHSLLSEMVNFISKFI